MNLHQIASQYTSAVNPWITATIQVSTGFTTDANFIRVPSYAAPVSAQVQMQSLTYNDLKQIDGLNLQGERRAMYLNGGWDGIVRQDQKGGDLITLPNGTVWLVAMVLEDWSDLNNWVKLCVTRQNNS